MKWISVKHRLPKQNEKILLCWPEVEWQDASAKKLEYKPGILIGYYKYPNFQTVNEELVWPLNEISHWMPLPSAPTTDYCLTMCDECKEHNDQSRT